MDVLQLLKAEIRDRKAELEALAAQASAAERKETVKKAILTHVAWEMEFLLPEVSHIASGSDAILERYSQSLDQVKLTLAEIERDSSRVAQSFASHAEIVEEKLLPLMRQKIPTAEREELYHVFADAKQEMMATSGSSYVM